MDNTKRINQVIRFIVQNHHYCFVSVNFAFEGIDHKFNAFGIRRIDPSFDKELKHYLFTDKPLTHNW